MPLQTQDVMQKDAPPPHHAVTFSTENASMTSGVFAKVFTNVTAVTVTPVKLLKQITDLKARIDSIKTSRPKRDVSSTRPTKLDTAFVTRLWLKNSTDNMFRSKLIPILVITLLN